MKPVIIAPLVALALAGGGAGAYFWVTSGGGTEEAAVAQPTPTPTAITAPSPTPTAAPSPTPLPGGKAPEDCASSEKAYVDPDGRFAFCYPGDMEISTAETPQGLAATVQHVPVEDPYNVSVSITFGVVEEPFTLCNDSMFVIKNERIEQLTIDGRSVEACFQDHYDRSVPPIFLFTTVELAVPRKGVPVQIVAGYGPSGRVQDGLPVRDAAVRIINSAVIN